MVLLVTSEDRDDGGAADHGEVPSKGCQMTDIRVMVGHGSPPGGQGHGQPGDCQRGKGVGGHHLRWVSFQNRGL